ncbi:WD40 repeat-like protein [Favolaschia claudopus]|uniref:WD40 repeat-like protein n=1 Tax=Favolaschia claudopus TaxID=2862362 RepID=A0AAW0D787_9AGAR
MFASSTYSQHGTLSGHHGAIYCMASTDDGKFFASGGKDGTRLWKLKSLTEISPRPSPPGIRGPTTAIVWTNREDEPGEVLFYGTLAGYLVSWRQLTEQSGFQECYSRRLIGSSEILALAFDSLSNRLAAASVGRVQLFSVATASPLAIYSITITNYVPKALQFGTQRGNQRDLLAFGRHDGKIRTLTGNPTVDQEAGTWEIGACIGDATIDSRKDTICVDDSDTGVRIYRIHDRHQVKLMHIPIVRENRPRQVRFGDDYRVVVVGSDHGIVYIFDRRTGQPVDQLKFEEEDFVQAIATLDCNGTALIFAARSGQALERNDIMIWRKAIVQPQAEPAVHRDIIGFFQYLIVIVLVIYVYQNSELLEGYIRRTLEGDY